MRAALSQTGMRLSVCLCLTSVSQVRGLDDYTALYQDPGGGGAGAGVPGFAGLRGVGGGVRAGVRGVEGDESVGRHAEDVDDNFGEKKQWTHKLWGLVRDAFGDG